MKPQTRHASATVDNTTWELWEHDNTFAILQDGVQIASTFSHGCEDQMAEIASAPVKRANQPTFLIAGMGLGFMLSALMEQSPKERAQFTIAEPCADIIGWHESILSGIHDNILQDPRVTVEYAPVSAVARKYSQTFHAILIKSAHMRYTPGAGELSDLCSALKQGGLLLIAVSKADTRLEKDMRKAGFDVSVTQIPSSHKGKKTHLITLILGRKGRFVSQNR